jgi:hypothetical protein
VTRDLALLATAEQVVMSNSTFCWWGVVAGQTPGRERVVIAPRPWLMGAGLDGKADEDSLLRPEWLTVDAV